MFIIWADVKASEAASFAADFDAVIQSVALR